MAESFAKHSPLCSIELQLVQYTTVFTLCILFFLVGVLYGKHMQHKVSNGYVSVVRSWWDIHVVHRREAVALNSALSYFGFDIGVFDEGDISLMIAGVSTSILGASTSMYAKRLKSLAW